MEHTDIAVVGMSICCAAGGSVNEFWKGISGGGDFITDAPEDIIEPYYFDANSKGADRFYANRGGFFRFLAVDPLRYGILPVTTAGMDPEQLASLEGADLALRDAGVFEKNISVKNGCIMIGRGAFPGLISIRNLEIVLFAQELINMLHEALPELSEQDLEHIKKLYQDSQGYFRVDSAIGSMPNLISSLIANKFDMHGPAYSIDAACASGIVAIDNCINMLRSGQCDIAVAGGMHTIQNASFFSVFNQMGAMSKKGQISPFSKDADGLLVGQGMGFVCLKTVEKAIKDEDRIYAVIKGSAVCSDGGGSHVMVTSVEGQMRVFDLAWKKAGMDPATLGYIEAHGTGTPIGDRTEINTLKTYFGGREKPQAWVGSVKSNVGHTMAAAGMVGFIKTALSIYHRTIPPTLHCEEPLDDMFESRFLPPGKAIEWDGEKYPVIAGVSAFGFGGINAHAVLAAYKPEKGAPPVKRPKPYYGDALMVSAKSKEALIEKLRAEDYTNPGGDYRIVIFEPNEKRIDQAVSIIEKDEPWRGRMDIWFSNKPLLGSGGKLAFMFPGINLNQKTETDSISAAFDLPLKEDMFANYEREGVTSRQSIEVFLEEYLSMEGLSKLGIEADMYIGHSVGEWDAANFAGITGGDWDKLTAHMDPWSAPLELPTLVISGDDCRKAEAWCDEIPDIYMANDNCPRQIIISGTKAATDELIARLTKEKMYYTFLDFGTGMHTPLLLDEMKKQATVFEKVDVREGRVPVWSPTTLEKLPTEKKAFVEFIDKQGVSTVRFRQLTEKLYDEENARIFVQVGFGALVGFVEDTLQDRPFGAISCNITARDGADQLRRVLALLFVEGRDVDADFLGVHPIYQTENSVYILPKGHLNLTELPGLRETVGKRYSGAGIGGGVWEDSGDPFKRAVGRNMREVIKVQDELSRVFGARAPVPGKKIAPVSGKKIAPVQKSMQKPVQKPAQKPAQKKGSAPANSFEETLRISMDDYPSLIDHSIVRQPQGWQEKEDLNPIVPFTMMLELLAEAGERQMPGRTLRQIRKVLAFRWIPVDYNIPFEGIIKGVHLNKDVLSIELKGYTKAELVFSENPPVLPKEFTGPIDLGDVIMPVPPIDEMYERYAFHGPKYQSALEGGFVHKHGAISFGEKKEGKGSMLDMLGQQSGLYLKLLQPDNLAAFPVRMNELTFFSDIHDQEGQFEFTMKATRVDDNSIVGDTIIKRDGKVWGFALGFAQQRFATESQYWDALEKPTLYTLAKEIAPGVWYQAPGFPEKLTDFISRRYLGKAEKAEYRAQQTPESRTEYLYSRIALKDAIRVRVAPDPEKMAFPIEIISMNDEDGRPSVRGHGALAKSVDALCVSLAHKDKRAIAAVSDTAVGVDIETIESKSDGFYETAFTEGERAMLSDMPGPQSAIRFWVAKEACAKKAGTGLCGNPKRFEISAADGDVLTVAGEKVRTVLLDEKYIAGWTI